MSGKRLVFMYFVISYVLLFAAVLPGYDWLYDENHDIKMLIGTIIWFMVLCYYMISLFVTTNNELIRVSFHMWRLYLFAALGSVAFYFFANLNPDNAVILLVFFCYVFLTPFGLLLGLMYCFDGITVGGIYISVSIVGFLICYLKFKRTKA